MTTLLLMTPACFLGGQSTDDTGTCDTTQSALESDATVVPELGFAPAMVTAWAFGGGTVRGRWQAPPTGIAVSPVPGEVTVEYTVQRGEGPAVFVSGCAPRVEVPAKLHLSTDDGQLIEHTDAVLTTRTPGFAVVQAPLRFQSLDGAFTWQTSESNIELVQPTLTLWTTPHGAAGEFGAILQVAGNGDVSDVPGGSGLLVWPSNSPCGDRGVPRGPETAEAAWKAALEYGTQQHWASAPDSDSSDATLSLTAEPTLCDFEDGSVTSPGLVEIISNSEHWSLSIPGAFSANAGRFEFSSAPSTPLSGSPADFTDRFGNLGIVGLDEYESVAIELALWLEESDGAGTLSIVGYVDDCQSTCDAQGCGSCGPLTGRTLRQITFAP